MADAILDASAKRLDQLEAELARAEAVILRQPGGMRPTADREPVGD